MFKIAVASGKGWTGKASITVAIMSAIGLIIATVMYSNGILLRCFDRKSMENLDLIKISFGEALRSKEFVDMANSCKDRKFSCVGYYALDASGIWRFD